MGRKVIFHWYSEHILLCYDGYFKVYVFKDAQLMDAKRHVLNELISPNIANLILELIGLEYYGEWMASLKGQKHYRQSQLSAYFGAKKQYAIITNERNSSGHTIVDLDEKYRVQNKAYLDLLKIL